MSYYICSYLNADGKLLKQRRVNASSHEEASSIFRKEHIITVAWCSTIKTKLGRISQTFSVSSIEDDEEEEYDDDEEEDDDDEWDEEYYDEEKDDEYFDDEDYIR